MRPLKLHFDGWVALPAGVRQQLGLKSGDRIDVALVDGTIVLRPVGETKHQVLREDKEAMIASPALDAPEQPMLPDTALSPRKRGRPRKHPAATEVAAPVPKRPRGRPRKVRMSEPEPTPAPAVGPEFRKLRRKVDLQPKETPAVPTTLSSPLPYRSRSRAALPAEERRPFRNVEVRKLAPGRRQNGGS